jgi:hypothetical protein
LRNQRHTVAAGITYNPPRHIPARPRPLAEKLVNAVVEDTVFSGSDRPSALSTGVTGRL